MSTISKPQQSARVLEIDLIRGAAVVLMIISHIWLFGIITCKNLKSTNMINLSIEFKTADFIFNLVGQIAYTLFIFLVGLNMVTSYKKTLLYTKKDKYNKINRNYIVKNIKRALFVFILGIFMSILVKWLFGYWYIVFGIFQFIGVSILLAIPFQLLYNPRLIIGVVILLLIMTRMVNNIVKPTSTLMGVLIGRYKFQVLDYFPMLPYFAYVLLGILLGNIYYTNKEKNSKIKWYNNKELNKSLQMYSDTNDNTNDKTKLDKIKNNAYIKDLVLIGKNSIKLYFAHLCIIFLVIKLLVRKNKIIV